jgi:hypothetical protein
MVGASGVKTPEARQFNVAVETATHKATAEDRHRDDRDAGIETPLISMAGRHN